jgi:hypothetical protein
MPWCDSAIQVATVSRQVIMLSLLVRCCNFATGLCFNENEAGLILGGLQNRSAGYRHLVWGLRGSR